MAGQRPQLADEVEETADGMEDSQEEISAMDNPATSSQGPLSKVRSLIRIARSGSSRDPIPTETQPDYLSLEGQEPEYDVRFTVDRTPGHDNAAPIITDLICPAMLEDMLFIVRELRKNRSPPRASSLTTPHSHHTHQHAQLVTPAQADKDRAKERTNNYIYTNADDFDDYE